MCIALCLYWYPIALWRNSQVLQIALKRAKSWSNTIQVEWQKESFRILFESYEYYGSKSNVNFSL